MVSGLPKINVSKEQIFILKFLMTKYFQVEYGLKSSYNFLCSWEMWTYCAGLEKHVTRTSSVLLDCDVYIGSSRVQCHKIPDTEYQTTFLKVQQHWYPLFRMWPNIYAAVLPIPRRDARLGAASQTTARAQKDCRVPAHEQMIVTLTNENGELETMALIWCYVRINLE